MSDPYDAISSPHDPYDAISAPAPAAAQSPDYLTDIIRSLPPGLLHGITSFVDLPELLQPGAGYTREQINKVAEAAKVPQRIQPLSSVANAAVSAPFGGEYQPKTKPGEYAESIASFAPAAIAGPEGLVPKIASVIGPGIGSKLGGDLAKGTRFQDAASTVGALLGGGLTGARISPKSAATDTVPTTAALKNAAHGAYDKAEQAGVIVKPDSLQALAGTTKAQLANEGIHPVLHSNAMAALGSLQEAAAQGTPITLKGLDTLRQVASDAVSNSMMKPADKRLSYIVKNNIDDFVKGLQPNDLLGSQNPQAAIDALTNARQLWTKASKAEIIQKRIDRASDRASQYSQAGNENALRVEFRNLAMNEKAMARFTKPEQDAIRAVSKGGPVTNILRHLGKFSPQGPVSAVLGGGAGFIAGGAPGAIALPALGAASKFGATLLTRHAAETALRQMQRGKPAPINPLLSYTNPYPGLFGRSGPQGLMPATP